MNLLLRKMKSLLVMVLFITLFYQCSSSKKLTQEEYPFQVKDVYYQKWMSNVNGPSLGWIVALSLKKKPTNISLDSLYYRGEIKPFRFESSKKEVTYVAFFDINKLRKPDMIMSSDINAEYGNEFPIGHNDFIKMKRNNCVLFYTESGKTKRFMFTNMRRKQDLISLGDFPN